MKLLKKTKYNTELSRGLGLFEETKVLFSLYSPGMTSNHLYETALKSGMLPNISSKRLKNIVSGCFTPRYIKTDSAKYLKLLSLSIPANRFNQILLIFTCIANPILFDFIIKVYWQKYASGNETISGIDAKQFVKESIHAGLTTTIWSEAMETRVSSYLLGCLSDYKMISSEKKRIRIILNFKIFDETTLFLSYWLHFQDIGDNSLIHHELWKIFGLEPMDVREELKRISLTGSLIVQAAGDMTRISWKYGSMEEVLNVISKL
ncbi:DUF1819 family protein [Leptospira selangorensis]|uniref:DUF1819 family protein n=1 Tax=Leptospira selangorensis TaxID=2484982 RepID=A0ABY2NAT9_9LEPT|nr:DUF1819 family protein [Leptospira selangorensis]